jgi:predicted metalloprotease with PDZ domain
VWLGFDTRGERGRAVVTHVLAGSPAMTGGLYAGDEIVAIDGWRADEKGCRHRCAEHAPGDRIAFHVLRRDRLVELAIVAAEPPKDTAWFEVDAAASPDAKKALESWAG